MKNLQAKILLFNPNSKKDFFKDFKNLEEFNKYKEEKLLNNIYIKYQIKFKEDLIYYESKIEYSKNKDSILKKDKYNKSQQNKIQRNSRQNNIALVGNDLVNLSTSNLKINSFLNSNLPITNEEIRILKSMTSYKTLTVTQYNLVKDIKEKVKRRKKVTSFRDSKEYIKLSDSMKEAVNNDFMISEYIKGAIKRKLVNN